VQQSDTSIEGNPSQKGTARINKWSRKLILGFLIFIIGSVAILVVVPAVSPAVGANMADFLRTVFGPQPVALLESVSFHLHDTISRYLYHGDRPQIGWNRQSPLILQASNSRGHIISHGIAAMLALAGGDVVTAMPQIGWQTYGPTVNGANALARVLINNDPQRPYTGIALVRIDLSKLQLHVMPGYLEPSHSPQVVKAFPSLGMVPAGDQDKLIAAFNGGFKTINGHFGMMVNGLTLIQPRPNIATVAIYRDGHIQIGAWEKDIFPSTDMIALRQNCPPLIDAGQLNSDLSYNNRNEWGYTGNTDITWRTGLGISQDSRYLIYAVGNGTSAMTLAQALKDAGAYSAMQLDINQYYAHFETYQPDHSSNPTASKLVAERLLDKMINEVHLYLTPNTRDFFYLTAR